MRWEPIGRSSIFEHNQQIPPYNATKNRSGRRFESYVNTFQLNGSFGLRGAMSTYERFPGSTPGDSREGKVWNFGGTGASDGALDGKEVTHGKGVLCFLASFSFFVSCLASPFQLFFFFMQWSLLRHETESQARGDTGKGSRKKDFPEVQEGEIRAGGERLGGEGGGEESES